MVYLHRTVQSDVVVYALRLTRTRGTRLETSTKFWKSGFKFASGRNKKGKAFGILCQLKKLSKSNDVHAQNFFFSST